VHVVYSSPPESAGMNPQMYAVRWNNQFLNLFSPLARKYLEIVVREGNHRSRKQPLHAVCTGQARRILWGCGDIV
jgi:hypothetical protein